MEDPNDWRSSKWMLVSLCICTVIVPSGIEMVMLSFLPKEAINIFLGTYTTILYIFTGYAGYVLACSMCREEKQNMRKCFPCSPVHLLLSAFVWMMINLLMCWAWASMLQIPIIIFCHLVPMGYGLGYAAGVLKSNLSVDLAPRQRETTSLII